MTRKNNYVVNISFKSPPTAESYKSANDIVQLMKELLDELDELLGLNKLLKSPKNIIIQRFKLIEKLINQKNKNMFKQEYCYMRLFTKDLVVIKNKNLRIFNHFKRDIIRQSHRVNWYGIRTEVSIAANLLLNFNGSVKKSESPDFILNEGTSPIYIESTMALVTSKKTNVLYKIGATINKKNSKPYANNHTVLCIDLTNIFHRFFDEPNNQEADFFNWIECYLNDNEIKYGAVIVLVNLYLPEQGRCQSAYSTYKLNHCSDNLNIFLQDVFPNPKKGFFENPAFSENS